MVQDYGPSEGYEHSRHLSKDVLSVTGVPKTRRGDFILTHGTDIGSRLIRIGQWLRYWGKNRKYTYWSHAALIVGEDGEIIEALGPAPGVRPENLAKYAPREYTIVHIRASQEDRDEAVHFAKSCVGESYGVLTIVSIVLSLLTGTKFSFGFDGQQICSGLVARALERTTAIFKSEPSHIMPADLARTYRVTPP